MVKHKTLFTGWALMQKEGACFYHVCRVLLPPKDPGQLAPPQQLPAGKVCP